METIRVNASTKYDILVGKGLLSSCGERIREISDAGRAVIVTDDNVAPLYAETVQNSLHQAGLQTDTFVFPHGEESKSHQTLIELYDFLSDHQITRSDLLIALGGGVVGDLTGYSAATYLRGIDFVQIPTTLLAQIDSSVGGKTAVDTSRGKNLVGAFKQPRLVLCDTDTLQTLPPAFFSDGMAEAIKYGLIKDKALFELIETQDLKTCLEQIICTCIKIKAQVVEADEFDKGERMLLNFGHTIGHAIERHYNYQTYTHGCAVGVGMVYLSKIFEKQGKTPPGTAERIMRCLKKYHLPCSVEITPDDILQYSLQDKKRSKQQISLIVLNGIGHAEICPVTVDEYRTLLKSLQPLETRAVLTPAALNGSITAPPSKSFAHRALIAAALSQGMSTIQNVAYSEDILATMECLSALGADFQRSDSTVTVTGIQSTPAQAALDCRESGSTLRFLLPIAAAYGAETSFSGKGKLPERPMTPYLTPFAQNGALITQSKGMPLTVTGKLFPGLYELDGNISSQFVTGLLFVLPLLEGDSIIRLKSPLQSKDYVRMTIEILTLAGIIVEETENGYRIPGKQCYRPFSYTVEGDYSQAAFFLTAGAVGEPVTCTGLNPHSLQGDKKILDILRGAGADVTVSEDAVTVSPALLRSFVLDGSDIPDLVPVLSVLAAYCDGTSEINHIERLKLKESDRIATTADMLSRFGVPVKAMEDALVIYGGRKFSGSLIDSHHDHRIAMSAAIASIGADSTVTIEDAACVAKSYPAFFEDFNKLGGKANVIPME